MSVSQKLRWKRCLNRLRFAHEEVDLVGEISLKTGPDFQAYLERYCAENNINLRSLNKDHSEKVEEAYKNLRAEKQKGNLLGDDQDETQLNVLQSFDESVSKEDIEFEREDSEIHETFSKLKREINVVESKLDNKKTTYNYLFAECETDEEKNNLVKKFINQLFGI